MNQMKHDWPKIMPKVIELRKNGTTWEKVTEYVKENFEEIPRTMIYQRWRFEMKRAGKEPPIREYGATGAEPKPVDDLQTVALARKILHRAVLGDTNITPAQINAAKSILSKEADVEFKSPYAGIPVEELCERVLVCAVGLCGLPMVITKLRSLASAGTLQVSGVEGIEDIIGAGKVEAGKPETETSRGGVEEINIGG